MRFLEAWDRVQGFVENDDTALSAITTGQNVASDFWDNFIMVCNNKEGVAALLGVSPDKVATWPTMIKEKLDQAEPEDSDPTKTSLIHTGDHEGEV
jgi:hypothetical protein